MNIKNRQQLYAMFLQVYNTCAQKVAYNITEMMLNAEPWTARNGKEKEMLALKELWSELDLVELLYSDETTYHAGLNAVRRKLLLVGA